MSPGVFVMVVCLKGFGVDAACIPLEVNKHVVLFDTYTECVTEAATQMLLVQQEMDAYKYERAGISCGSMDRKKFKLDKGA